MGRPANTPDRILTKIDAAGPCWEWTGTVRSDNGYGQVSVDYRSTLAHRAVWEILVGPIPDGMTLDHLCRNRSCVNPDHLEVVTIGVNTGRSPIAVTAVHGRKTHCLNGHAFTSENIYVIPSGGRACRTCRTDRKRKHRAENR